jgi:hypothetical protein
VLLKATVAVGVAVVLGWGWQARRPGWWQDSWRPSGSAEDEGGDLAVGGTKAALPRWSWAR